MFDAWAITATTITYCFRKAGFASASIATETESEAHADAPRDDADHFPTLVNMSGELFNEFIDLDSQEPVTGEIVESVKHRKMEASQQQSQEDVEEDDDPVSVTMPSSSLLKQSLNNIRCFMEFNGLTSGITKNIQAHVSTKTVQTSFTEFLQRK